jgi:hypothetical protein
VEEKKKKSEKNKSLKSDIIVAPEGQVVPPNLPISHY